MRKDNRYYTFLLSHTTKEKIYIRRLEISKKILHTSAASLVLTVGIASMGIFGLLNTNGAELVAGLNTRSSTARSADEGLKAVSPISKNNSIDYSRPQGADDFALNSGGPSDYKLTTTETKGEDTEIERRLSAIETKSSPEFLPTIWAHLGKINNEFGFRRNPFGGRSYEFHSGMDIDGDRGDMVVAPANGTVVTAGWLGGYGRMVEIDHGNGLTTRYGHLSKLEVSAGDLIQRGQLIGLVGSTGRSTGPHLHYELRLDSKPINPRRFLPPEPRLQAAN
ncbi:MAG: M23 family metallopeptidase [Acidobacteria bacterium]|nr:M23 family metallopeptidase [Acidobacteriota bacterium]